MKGACVFSRIDSRLIFAIQDSKILFVFSVPSVVKYHLLDLNNLCFCSFFFLCVSWSIKRRLLSALAPEPGAVPGGVSWSIKRRLLSALAG